MPSNEGIQEIRAEITEEEITKQQKPTTFPVCRKYLDAQDRYPQTAIIMRLSDFNEVFGKSTEVLNKLLLSITRRDYELDSRVLMVGLQYYTEEKTASLTTSTAGTTFA